MLHDLEINVGRKKTCRYFPSGKNFSMDSTQSQVAQLSYGIAYHSKNQIVVSANNLVAAVT